MDPFRPFRRGEKFIPQADFLNDVQEMLKWWHRQIGTKAGKVVVPGETEIWVRNSDVLTDRPQYSIISLGAQLVGPDAAKDYFFGKAIFELAAPVESSPFAILQSPAHKGGGIVEARIGGWSWCVIMQNSAAHTWADPIEGEYDFLTSASTGMAKVLWDGDAIVAPPTTTLSNSIGPDDLDIDVTSTTGWSDLAVKFVVTIGTEDILIESVDSSAWRARERGYGGTTKATHAVDASVAFKAGCVWALIGWDTRGETASEPGDADVESGSYTPTVANVANTSNLSAYAFSWLRIANVVHVSGVAVVTTDAAASTSFTFTLPVVSSLYASGPGASSGVSNYLDFESGNVELDSGGSGSTALVSWFTNFATNSNVYITFTYRTS